MEAEYAGQWAGGAAAFVVLGFSLAGLAALVALLAVTAPSRAANTSEVASATLSVADAVDRDCTARLVDGAGAGSLEIDSPSLADASYGIVEARLRGPAGSDWDLAVFDSSTGEVVAASTFRGSEEVASGFLVDQTPLVVQACRLDGDGEAAQLSVATKAITVDETQTSSLVNVDTPTRRDKETLQGLGLDLTEHGDTDHVAVVLHGDADREALEKAGLDYEVETPDLVAQSARQREAEASYARETRASSLPSSRDTYRRLFDYTQELKDLAANNPGLTRPITLPNETYEGRPVEGIEITTNADNIRDGKPVFLQMGTHHAREWPSSEHAMEWAYELIKGYKSGNARTRRLVETTRTIIIPIVNPDGFNASREAGQQQGNGNGNDGTFLMTFPVAPNEYRRKNCRLPDDSPSGNCAQPAFGIQSGGVDPNRNYGGFWGGPGASEVQVDEDYRGPGPFSEPETQNIRSLISHRQVTVLITNHTFSNLVLRPPGLASQPDPVDEPFYKSLGDAMAGQNGYLSQKSYELYDTSGTTEDWSYNATGGFGFTFEIYCNHVPDPIDDRCSGNFHPTFPKVVAEYGGGQGSDAPAGAGGNREAYFLAMEAAADAQRHSLLRGSAPPGAVLTLEKTFQTPTLNEPASFEDHLETQMLVPDSGRFDYHINPSTRPLVAQSRGRQAQGPPSAAITFAGAPNPATNMPCASAETDDPNCFDEHAFEITNPAGVDNDSVTVEIDWPTSVSDWDLYVYRDGNGDGDSLDPEDTEVASSAQGTTASESATFVRPEAADGRLEPGKYVARVVNFAAVEPYEGEITFEGPETFVPAKTETWKLTCSFAGEKRVTQDILIARGESRTLDLSACGQRVNPATGKKFTCGGRVATLVGSKRRNRINGTKRRDVISGLGSRDVIKGRGGNDLICGGGGNDRVGGGRGKDQIAGAKGKDLITGAAGSDRLRGGGGADGLRGGKGLDRCNGGKGKDRLRSCERPRRKRKA